MVIFRQERQIFRLGRSECDALAKFEQAFVTNSRERHFLQQAGNAADASDFAEEVDRRS